MFMPVCHDGFNWESIDLPAAYPPVYTPPNRQHFICFDGTQFVYIASDAFGFMVVVTSPDLYTWTATTTTFTNKFGSTGVAGLTYANGLYVHYGDTGVGMNTVCTSTDRVNWNTYTDGRFSRIIDVLYHHTGVWIVSTDSGPYTTTDFSVLTPAAVLPTPSYGWGLLGTDGTSVYMTDGPWSAYSTVSGNTIGVTLDGVNWTSTAIAAAPWNSISSYQGRVMIGAWNKKQAYTYKTGDAAWADTGDFKTDPAPVDGCRVLCGGLDGMLNMNLYREGYSAGAYNGIDRTFSFTPLYNGAPTPFVWTTQSLDATRTNRANVLYMTFLNNMFIGLANSGTPFLIKANTV